MNTYDDTEMLRFLVCEDAADHIAQDDYELSVVMAAIAAMTPSELREYARDNMIDYQTGGAA